MIIILYRDAGPGERHAKNTSHLEQILGLPVDVVSATSIRNPYFRDEVMRTRETLYAA